MKRRTFLHTAMATGGLAALPALTTAAEDTPKPARQLVELRTYLLRADKQPLLDAYLSKALIPALNRLGVKSVGAFSELPAPPTAAPQATPPATTAPPTPIAYLLIPYQSAEQMAAVTAGLWSDLTYQNGAAEYLSVTATDPVYDRVESSLFSAIDGMPQLAAPTGKPTLFNLRIYESHNEAAAKKKIEMFNQGELSIFRRVGLTPVFFGEALVGARLPNLTYLLAFADEAARADAWKKFGGDPEWKALRAIPEYEDKRIVSKITNKLLAPAEYSQI